MNSKNVAKEKSFTFALQIIAISRSLQNDQREYVLSKQILRSGTSIGANIEEATDAQSKKDFISKLSISLKEARETHYWLKLLQHSKLITEKEVVLLENMLDEIIRILVSSIKTAKRSV